MASEKKKTGLGADALFSTAPITPQPQPEPQAQPAPAAPPAKESEKMRTTVMLATDVVILLNRMKEASIAAGQRQTQGELIEEAIRTLARIRDIKI